MTSTQSSCGLRLSSSIRPETKHGRAASEVPASLLRHGVTTVSQCSRPGKVAPLVSYTDKAENRRKSYEGLDISMNTRPNPENSGMVFAFIEEDLYDDSTDCQFDQANPLGKIQSFSNPLETIAEPLSASLHYQGDQTDESDCQYQAELGLSAIEDHEGRDMGSTFEELIDRLLSRPISKLDSKYAITFLCFYRKFAAPYVLITAIIRRFEDLDKESIPYLTRITSRLRYLNVIKEWIADYPGDFSHQLTRRTLAGFVQGLQVSQEYAIISKEITPYLDVVCEDDDIGWAYSDWSRSRANTMESSVTMSSVRSAASTLNADSPTLTADSSAEDITDIFQAEKGVTTQSLRISTTPSSNSSISRVDSLSISSLQELLHPADSAKRQAHTLVPRSHHLLTKVQWHQFMELPANQIARELTRIDWIMFSSIKPRDLIRHVSLPIEQKGKCKSLELVDLMINHFNHIAFWVANMVLLRDKPKHRAKALEKFMGVAWQLRYLNNYNSLGALIAGINGTAVHRLAQTRELVPSEAQKQFMRLEILMGTQKSHFAYRLAFSNTSTQRIPFLPLHRRDLVLAEQGNRTFLPDEDNERINWKKFEIMGEIIISIRRSQEIPYPDAVRSEEIQQLILDGRFCKDDDVSKPIPLVGL